LTEPAELDRLIARLSEGDRSAFTAAFRLLWPPVLRLCQGMVQNTADAEDAAQQAMEKIFSRHGDYDPRRPAMPWALAIASWECRTIRQRRLRRREAPEPAERELVTGDAQEAHVEHELVAHAINALGTLSDVDRKALIATFWEEGAGVSGATLRKRRERALVRLRDAFRRLYGLD
jgi:RNA polymerase sigma-70 factor, ECF subfamily